MKEEYSFFDISVDDHIANVAFNRPEKSNALDLEAWHEMKNAFETLSNRDDVRVVILTGRGRHFCAGIDLGLLMNFGQYDNESCEARKREQLRSFILMLQSCITAIERCKKPVIAAIHGACIGGGLDIVTACDIRFCTDNAYFSIKEVDMGLVADIGTLQRLPRIVQPGKMAEWAYTGRNIDAVEAESSGLVNGTFPGLEEMLEQVGDLAGLIASKSPLVVRGTKEMIRYTREHRTEDALEFMATYNAAFLLSDDLKTAFQSHVTKDLPIFKN